MIKFWTYPKYYKRFIKSVYYLKEYFNYEDLLNQFGFNFGFGIILIKVKISYYFLLHFQYSLHYAHLYDNLILYYFIRNL